MSTDTGSTSTSGQSNELTDTQKHQLRHRELFLTRQNETLLATNIRGKCLVTLHNETETFVSYLNSEVKINKTKLRSIVCLFVHFKGSIFLSTCL
jgi:hypothetical protein